MTTVPNDRDSLVDMMLELDTMLTEGGQRREQCELILDALAEHGFRQDAPITDAQVTAAMNALHDLVENGDRPAVRAALEAARDAS
jgi:hypothetical protein